MSTTAPGHRLLATGRGLLDRAVDPAAERMWWWIGPLLVAAFAGITRFWHLGQPHQLVFDETYYVKQAYSYLQTGYELRWPEGADASFTQGTPDVFSSVADYPVHPPVGKWMIAAGIELFGVQSSFGWRFSVAVLGTLMVLMTARIGRRLLGSTLLGCTAGLLLAVDGLHLVMSRTSLLDLPLAFWVLAAFGCLLIDRDQHRDRLAGRLVRAARLRGGGWRWWVARWRLWRFAAALCLGLACGVKWSGLYVTAVFSLMAVLWGLDARRAAGQRGVWKHLVPDGLRAALVVLPTVFAVYLASWVGWFRSSTAHLRQWAAENPTEGVQWLPPALRSLWKYHQDMWAFHLGLTADHKYQSNPWSWLVQGRPTSFFYEGPKLGESGCRVDTCSKAITSLGNPVVWWGAVVALLVLLFCWVLRRDWRAGAILAGVAAGYLPWFQYQERTIFTFYAVIFTPFLALALAYVGGLLLGPPRPAGAGGPAAGSAVDPAGAQTVTGRTRPDRRRVVGVVVAGGFVLLAIIAFWFFYPVWTAQVIPYSSWRARMWFTAWI